MRLIAFDRKAAGKCAVNMIMRIDQSGQYQSAVRIDELRVGVLLRKIVCRPDCENSIVLQSDRAVFKKKPVIARYESAITDEKHVLESPFTICNSKRSKLQKYIFIILYHRKTTQDDRNEIYKNNSGKINLFSAIIYCTFVVFGVMMYNVIT